MPLTAVAAMRKSWPLFDFEEARSLEIAGLVKVKSSTLGQSFLLWCGTSTKLYTHLASIALPYRGWKYNGGVIFLLFRMPTIRVC